MISLQGVHKYLQAAWAPAGQAVQIEILNNPIALPGHMRAWAGQLRVLR